MSDENLKLSTPADLKKELFKAPIELSREMEVEASAFVDKLLDLNTDDQEAMNDRKNAIEQLALDQQKRAAKQSELLRLPMKKLSENSEEGGEVSNALINLKLKVEELDPGKFDFEAGWFTRTLGRLPGVGSPLKRYFSKFESAQTVIATILRSLEKGKEQLQRDNITLFEDQKEMQEATKKLEKAVQLGILIDQKLQYKLDREIESSDPKHKFISEELLFPLRQRIIDLQQQLAVSQQTILATEIIIRNNKELIRGVDRALNVTISALETAASVAMALANQKIVLDKIHSVNETTSNLIKGTAARLKTQGVEIHKQASGAQLSLSALKSSFQDIKTAMEDVSNFRMNSLPQMASTILELEKISNEANVALQKMEEGNKAKPQIKLEI